MACKNEQPKISDIEIWRLGWRMVESSMNKDMELAELQFDSLLSSSGKMNANFLITGLETKHRLGKDHAIAEILARQDDDILRQICGSEFLANMNICKGFLEEKVKNKVLQTELIRMYVDDQAVRGNILSDIISKYELDVNKITQDEAVAVDERNRNRLKEIFKEVGFPNVELVGKDAMHGIFLIIQHSNNDEVWQKDQLTSIEQAVKSGDMDGQSYAYLYDRIKINAGEKQLYGTQFKSADLISKKAELAETQDVENLDMRRMEVGMMPIDMYKRFMLKDL